MLLTGYDTKECSECSESNDSPAGGGVYTRWGRSDCPGGSELVYSGKFLPLYTFLLVSFQKLIV